MKAYSALFVLLFWTVSASEDVFGTGSSQNRLASISQPSLIKRFGSRRQSLESSDASQATSTVLDIKRGGGSKIKSVQTKTVQPQGGKASVITSIFNLSNNVAGAGILTLAAGKASGTGWIPSILICAAIAFCSSHTFILIAKACEMT